MDELSIREHDREPKLHSEWTLVRGHPFHARICTDAAPPDRPPVILVHGAAVSSRNMAPTAEVLAEHVPVYCPDLPGHGLTPNAEHSLDLDGFADALADWMDAKNLTSARLLGSSFGCQIISSFALRHTERIDRAVLQGPTVDPQGHGLLRQLARWTLNAVREGATQPTMTLREWMDAGPKTFIMTLRHMGRDRIEHRLPLITIPTMVVRGERDPIIPQLWAEQAAALLPNGSLRVVTGETHTMVLARPERLVHATLDFLLED